MKAGLPRPGSSALIAKFLADFKFRFRAGKSKRCETVRPVRGRPGAGPNGACFHPSCWTVDRPVDHWATTGTPRSVPAGLPSARHHLPGRKPQLPAWCNGLTDSRSGFTHLRARLEHTANERITLCETMRPKDFNHLLSAGHVLVHEIARAVLIADVRAPDVAHWLQLFAADPEIALILTGSSA